MGVCLEFFQISIFLTIITMSVLRPPLGPFYYLFAPTMLFWCDPPCEFKHFLSLITGGMGDLRVRLVRFAERQGAQ